MYKSISRKLKCHPNGRASLSLGGGNFLDLGQATGYVEALQKAADYLAEVHEEIVYFSVIPFSGDPKCIDYFTDIYLLILTRPHP